MPPRTQRRPGWGRLRRTGKRVCRTQARVRLQRMVRRQQTSAWRITSQVAEELSPAAWRRRLLQATNGSWRVRKLRSLKSLRSNVGWERGGCLLTTRSGAALEPPLRNRNVSMAKKRPRKKAARCRLLNRLVLLPSLSNWKTSRFRGAIASICQAPQRPHIRRDAASRERARDRYLLVLEFNAWADRKSDGSRAANAKLSDAGGGL